MDYHILLQRPDRRATALALAVTAVVLAGLAVIVWRAAGSPARYNRTQTVSSEEQLLSQCPWLSQTFSHWRQAAVSKVAVPTYQQIGAFPVGNGSAFGIIGLHWPFGTVSNLIGPSYQKQVGFFGNVVPWLAAEGKPVDLPEESVAWASDAPVVCVKGASDDGLALEIYYAAAPDLAAIVFAVTVANRGKAVRRDIAIGLSSNLPAVEIEPSGLYTTRPGVRMSVGLVGARARPAGSLAPVIPSGVENRMNPFGIGGGTGVLYPLGSLGPGQSVVKIGYIAFTRDGQEQEKILQVLAQARLGILDNCHARWQKWTEQVTQVSDVTPRVAEFLRAQQYIVASQQASAGGFSPMDGYTYLWVRDSNGPLRFFSAIGATGEVKRHLEYYFRVSATEGRVGNNMSLDRQVPRSLQQPDWNKVPVEAAEVPSFVILQHHWYYRASGDLSLIRWHWGLLRRCLLGQKLDGRGLLPFHGDETYRFPGYELFNAGRDLRDWVCLETCSADSAFEFVAAARAMAEMAAAQGKQAEAAEYNALAERVRAATESLYWQADRGFYAPSRSDFADQVHRYPFANINLRPLWIGYARAEDARQRQNVFSALRYLWQKNGRVTTTPTCGYYVGMTPGYVVWDLAELRHPAVRDALRGLLDSAETSGGFAEMVTPDGKPANAVWGLHRIRPWEGGINAEAVLHALCGYRPDAPHRRAYLRPLSVAGDSMTVNRLPLGDAGLSVHVEDQQGKRRYEITYEGLPGALTVDLAVVVWGSGLRITKLEATNAASVRPQPGPAWPWAQETLLPGLKLTNEDSIHVTVEYTPAPPASLPPAVPFTFGPASVPGGTRAIVLTCSPAQAETQRRRLGGGVYCVDTRIPWPVDYLRSALLQGGRPRVPTVVLDTANYPGAFKRADFWTKGDGAKVLQDYRASGGKLEQVANPSPAPKGYGGLATLRG